MSDADKTPGGGWPTTLRFSRRLGESIRGPDYAVSVVGFQSQRPLWLVHIRRYVLAFFGR